MLVCLTYLIIALAYRVLLRQLWEQLIALID